MQRTDSLEKTVMLGKTEGRRRRGRQRMRWLDGITKSEQALGVGDGQGSLVCCSPWGHIESDMTEPLNCTDKLSLVLLYNIYHIQTCIIDISVHSLQPP